MTEETKSSTKYVMVESSPSADKDEIDLLELIRTLLQAWKTIVGITIVCFGLAVAYALHAPEVFKAETLLAPASEEKSGASSALSQFGGLAAMAGISIPSDSNVDQVVATLQSRKFLRKYIEGKKLLPVLFEEIWDADSQSWLVQNQEDEPTWQKAVKNFKSILSVDEDKKSGLISLSISWKDSGVAAEWANDLVKQLNEQLREKAIADSQKRVGYLEQELAKTTLQDMRAVLYNLLESEKQKAMLANVNEDFALEVIDPAVTPENSEKPNRKLIVSLGGVCGVFLGIFAVFLAQFLRKLKTVKPS
ncbi:MAG: Wzz/FepE/Etk N-terminal domain-containing protein [Verrucomicrobiota bacterium]|nr:Wzz/FepE/Etk N-terminal domain-containing protein [Verrucomicrobiota bacterium]